MNLIEVLGKNIHSSIDKTVFIQRGNKSRNGVYIADVVVNSFIGTVLRPTNELQWKFTYEGLQWQSCPWRLVTDIKFGADKCLSAMMVDRAIIKQLYNINHAAKLPCGGELLKSSIGESPKCSPYKSARLVKETVIELLLNNVQVFSSSTTYLSEDITDSLWQRTWKRFISGGNKSQLQRVVNKVLPV